MPPIFDVILGAFGVGLFIFLETVFPPIPSELMMPLAGFQAARGEMNLIALLVPGTAGSAPAHGPLGLD